MNVINFNVNLFCSCIQNPWIIPVNEFHFNKVTDGRYKSYLKLVDSLVPFIVIDHDFSLIAWIFLWWIETDPILYKSFSSDEDFSL